MPNGDIITYSEDGEWKSKVAGSSRAAHVATLILALANGIAIERMLDPSAGDDTLLGIALQRVAFTAPTRVEP